MVAPEAPEAVIQLSFSPGEIVVVTGVTLTHALPFHFCKVPELTASMRKEIVVLLASASLAAVAKSA